MYTVETDRKNRESRYHSTVCTSARYDTTGLPVFHVNRFLSFWRISLHVVWALQEWRGAKSLSGGFDGLVTRFSHFSGNTDVLLRDEDATDTRIEQLEKDGRGFTFQKTVTIGYLNIYYRLCHLFRFFLHKTHIYLMCVCGKVKTPHHDSEVTSANSTCIVLGWVGS